MNTSPTSLNEPRTRNCWQTAQVTGDRGTATSSHLTLEPGIAVTDFAGNWVVERFRFDAFIHPIANRIPSGDSEHHR